MLKERKIMQYNIFYKNHMAIAIFPHEGPPDRQTRQ